MILYTSLLLVLLLGAVHADDGNFEETRCRCVCPSTAAFAANESAVDNGRRYYTDTLISPDKCTPVSVVRPKVSSVVEDARMDAFLANCDCRFESRNTVMLKVVVIFVMCVVLVLVTYMGFLMCLDPMLRKQRFSVPYRQHSDEVQMEDNMFARGADSALSSGLAGPGPSQSPQHTVRARSANNVLERVEAEQNKWMRTVEEQRKKIFTDHTMLN